MSTFVTGRSLGLLTCAHCRATVRAIAAERSRCPRCDARLHARKPHSLATTTALVLTLVALGEILYAVARNSSSNPRQRSRLFRIVEFIGRWSMLDVFAVALLVTLVQIRSLATVHVRLGALAFAAVVVLTMLAAQSFDERLLWDTQKRG